MLQESATLPFLKKNLVENGKRFELQIPCGGHEDTRNRGREITTNYGA